MAENFMANGDDKQQRYGEKQPNKAKLATGTKIEGNQTKTKSTRSN